MQKWQTEQVVREMGRRWWVLALGALLGVLAMLIVTALTPVQYCAQQVFHFDNCDTDVELSASDVSAARAAAESSLTILELRAFRQAVADAVGVGDPVRISGEVLNETAFVRLSVSADDAATANAAAQAVSQVFAMYAEWTMDGCRALLVDPPCEAERVEPPFWGNLACGFALGLFLSVFSVLAWVLYRTRSPHEEA